MFRAYYGWTQAWNLEEDKWKLLSNIFMFSLNQILSKHFVWLNITMFLTSDLGFEGASNDVVRTSVFDGN